MDHWLDDIARAMAGGVSRRRALGRIAALLGGAAVAAAVPAIASADTDGDHGGPCDEFCERLPKDQRDRCRDDAAHGHGPCYDCGPKGSNNGLCGGTCCANGGDCLNGKCVNCASGQSLQCLAGCSSTGTPCAAGTTCCAGVCASTSTDADNCGACGNKCAAGQTCANGKCSGGTGGCSASAQCPSGDGCCNGRCVALNTTANCGACGNQCTAANGTAACTNGICAVGSCNPGFGNCDGVAGNGCETNLSTDRRNCGVCGHQCTAANGTAGCANGVCTVISCNAGFANCDGMAGNGCETNVNTDLRNCGACGVVCGITADSCAGGRCVCGTTGAACATGQRCSGGVCICDATSCPTGCCDPQTNACLAGCAQSNSGHVCLPSHLCGCTVATDCPTGLACGSAGSCSVTCVPAIGSLCNGGCCSNNVCIATCSAGLTCSSGVCV